MFRYLLYSSVFVLIFSCGNDNSKQQQDLKNFEAINKTMEKIKSTTINNTGEVYDSLRRKLAGTDELPKIMEMKMAITDFYSYIGDLKKQFYNFCGNSEGTGIPSGKEGEINLTNQFIDQGYADDLYIRMQAVKGSLPPRLTPEGVMQGLVGTLQPAEEASEPVEKFLNTYFKDTPPVAAVNVLNAFELKVKTAESHVLTAYSNKYLKP